MAGGMWLLAGAAALAGTGADAAADAPPDYRDGGADIVIVATPLFDPGEDFLVFPAQTISDEQIQAAHALDLTDYLTRFAGGVVVNDLTGNPLQPDISYRGFTASPLLGTAQGLSVYLDGVRLNQPFGDVVSWDVLPTSALRSLTLIPGSNPLFGRNTLGGALAIRSKNGRSDPGVELEAVGGRWDRRIVRAQAGGSGAGGVHWFFSGDYFAEDGWRDFSPSEAGQVFGKLGWADGEDNDVALSVLRANADLIGNGLQELRLLRADRDSVYTRPDATENQSWLVNLTGRRALSDRLALSGNLFWRRTLSRTFNGDLNDEALGGEADDDECREGEEPDETCNALLNRTRTRQREWGGTLEARWQAAPGHLLTLGAFYAQARAHFAQSSQFGVLLPDRSVEGIPGLIADGTQDGEGDEVLDARVDLSGRTTNLSAYALWAWDVDPRLHLDVSARFDRATIRNRDAINPGGGRGSLDGDHRYHRLNPSVALRWQATPRLSLDAALTQTSRAPSTIELGCADPESPCRLPNALAGDPPLDQVIARTGEAGLSWAANGWRVRLGGYRTVARDDILFVAADLTGFGYFRNFGRTRRQGFDLDVARDIGRVRLSAHYSFLDATYRSAETVGGAGNSSNDAGLPGFEGNIAIRRGDRIPLLPRHLGKAAIDWTPIDRLTLSVDAVAASGVIARGNENGLHQPDGVFYLGPGRTNGYAIANLGLELRPAARLALWARVRNLFDRRFTTAAQLGPTGFDETGAFQGTPFDGPELDGEVPVQGSTFFGPGAPRSVQIGARVRF